jgi:hypothetical protein
MNRARVRELMLVAVAGSLLAFEVIGLRGALPTAIRSLTGAGVLDAMGNASRSAAVATASMLDGAGSSAAGVAVGAAKGAARLLGTVTPPAHASRRTEAKTVRSRTDSRCAVVVTLTEAGRTVHATCRSAHRVRPVRRAIEARGASTTVSTL